MNKKDSADVAFFLELWLWITRVEREHNVLVRYSVRPSTRRGICRCYIEVWSITADNRPHTRLVEVEQFNPDGSAAGRVQRLMAMLSEAEARIEEAIAAYKQQHVFSR